MTSPAGRWSLGGLVPWWLGAPLQTLALVASHQPLPSTQNWRECVSASRQCTSPAQSVWGRATTLIRAFDRSQSSAATVTTFAGQLGCLLHQTHHVLGHSLGACAPTRSAAGARQCVVCATNMSAAVASLLAQATPQDPMATGSAGLRSTSTDDGFITEKAKLRVSFGGGIVQVSRSRQLRCPWMSIQGEQWTHLFETNGVLRLCPRYTSIWHDHGMLCVRRRRHRVM
jgi:hypothetical protein